MGQNSKRKRKSQDRARKVLTRDDLHPSLVCDIEPDVRPSWPNREEWPSKPLDVKPTYQLDLFDELAQFLADLEQL